MKNLLFIVSALVIFSQISYAEDINTIFANVKKQVEAKNYPKALEELSWARKEIEKMNNNRLKELFPNKLGEYQGGKFNVDGMLGFSNIERTYTKGGTTALKVSLVGSANKSMGGMGGLAGFGRMAAMMQAQGGEADSFRIGGLTASVEKRGNKAKIAVFLDGGSILQIEADVSMKTDMLKQLAIEMKPENIDKYLKG